MYGNDGYPQWLDGFSTCGHTHIYLWIHLIVLPMSGGSRHTYICRLDTYGIWYIYIYIHKNIAYIPIYLHTYVLNTDSKKMGTVKRRIRQCVWKWQATEGHEGGWINWGIMGCGLASHARVIVDTEPNGSVWSVWRVGCTRARARSWEERASYSSIDDVTILVLLGVYIAILIKS